MRGIKNRRQTEWQIDTQHNHELFLLTVVTHTHSLTTHTNSG